MVWTRGDSECPGGPTCVGPPKVHLLSRCHLGPWTLRTRRLWLHLHLGFRDPFMELFIKRDAFGGLKPEADSSSRTVSSELAESRLRKQWAHLLAVLEASAFCWLNKMAIRSLLAFVILTGGRCPERLSLRWKGRCYRILSLGERRCVRFPTTSYRQPSFLTLAWNWNFCLKLNNTAFQVQHPR